MYSFYNTHPYTDTPTTNSGSNFWGKCNFKSSNPITFQKPWVYCNYSLPADSVHRSHPFNSFLTTYSQIFSPKDLSTLAWKIPWMEDPGRLQSMGSLRVGREWTTSLSLFHFHALEKEMATHSSVLAWRIPRTEEPGGLLSMGLHRVRHD